MYCSHCGNEVSENDKFCGKCGAPVSGPTSSSNSTSTGKFSDYMSNDLKNMSNLKSDNNSNCSRLAAALLAFFLGGFGAHRFYVGKTTSAVLMLLFCWTGIPSIIALIDFIMILCGTFTDAQGKVLKAL